MEAFCADILKSTLCSSSTFASLNEAVELYHSTLTEILEKHAPLVQRKFKTNKTPWWSKKCQEARNVRRRAERAFRKDRNHSSAIRYKECCVDAAITIEKERNRFYHDKLHSLAGNSRETYKVVNHLLDKEYGNNVYPNGENDEVVANKLVN